MSIETPDSKKRPLSEGSTPSPTVKKTNKAPKMASDEDQSGLPAGTGASYSQEPSMDLVNSDNQIAPSDILNPPTDPERRWTFVLEHIQTLHIEVNRLQKEN